MRFISCPGKVDISRQGQIFTRAKETAAAPLRIWRCELLWWQFSSELRGARFCPRWEGSGWEMFGDHQLIRQGAFCWQPSSYSYFWWDSNTNPLVVFFSFSFWRKIPLPWSYTSIWESIFCDSPFTLTFDKCSAIPLHFLKKVAHILTFDKSTSIYELISQIGKVLPNFLFSHHHFVQNGKLQTFNFNLMGGSNFRLTKVKNEERAKMFTIDIYGSLTNFHSLFYSWSLFLMIVASINIKKMFKAFPYKFDLSCR